MIKPRSPFQQSSSQNGFFNSASYQAKHSFSQTFGWSQSGLNRLKNSPFMNSNIGAKRFYYVDRYNVQHFKRRGPRSWFQNPGNILNVVLVSYGGFVIAIYFGHLETVPYTKRTHFLLLSKENERQIGESNFEKVKCSFKAKILPEMHPQSVRVRSIANDVIEAVQKGLRQDHKVWKKGQKRGSKARTCDLDGLKWEVLVVDEPLIRAFCLPGGKIVVFTGLLEHFNTDAEIATVISHEITIEVLLMASAGYDPRVAPKVYEKLGKIVDESTLKDNGYAHPSAFKRAQLLAQAQVMKEALTIYGEKISGLQIQPFFL